MQLLSFLSKKLSVHTLDPHAREILEDLYKETTPEFHIIKGIKTRNDKVNWLIDVDKRCKDFLLCKKRICIDFERYRVVEFVSIARCHNCQFLGIAQVHARMTHTVSSVLDHIS